MEKIFTLHIFDRGFLSGLCKELQISYKKIAQLRRAEGQ